MPEQQSFQIFELINREISSKGSLHSLLSHYSHSHISRLNHSHVISSVSNAQYSFILFPAVLDSFSECLLLAGRTSTAYNGWHFQSSFEEILRNFLILENKSQTLPINDQNLAKVFLDFRPLLVPLILVDHLFDLYVKLSCFLEPTRTANTLSCFHLITGDHPNLDPPTSQTLNR